MRGITYTIVGLSTLLSCFCYTEFAIEILNAGGFSRTFVSNWVTSLHSSLPPISSTMGSILRRKKSHFFLASWNFLYSYLYFVTHLF